jgi:hypothetical protein
MISWFKRLFDTKKSDNSETEFVRNNIKDICIAVQFIQQRMSSMDAKMTPETQSIDTIIGNLHTIQTRLNNIEYKVDSIGEMVMKMRLTEMAKDIKRNTKKKNVKKKNVKNK